MQNWIAGFLTFFQLEFVANLVQPFLILFKLNIFSINAHID